MSQIQVQLLNWMGDDRVIAESAWTSSLTSVGKEKRSDADVARLVPMLATSGHAVPFESVILHFWMRIPVFTDRQHMTHRIASHNGMSGRYRTMPNDFFEMPKDVAVILSKAESLVNRSWYNQMCQENHNDYEETVVGLKQAEKEGLITNDELKRAREFYRGILPQAAMTERTTTMNLRAWFNYIRLRLSPHAQPEVREVAAEMYRQVIAHDVAPIAIETVSKQGWLLDQPNHEWKKFI